MRAQAQTLSDWMILACAFSGSALFVFIAFSLALHVVYGAGSLAGNVLRAGTAAISLFMGIFCATVGTLYLKSFDEDHGNVSAHNSVPPHGRGAITTPLPSPPENISTAETLPRGSTRGPHPSEFPPPNPPTSTR